jgi:hypothetical protein
MNAHFICLQKYGRSIHRKKRLAVNSPRPGKPLTFFYSVDAFCKALFMVIVQGSLEHALNYGNQLMAEFCNTQAMELLPQVLACLDHCCGSMNFGADPRIHDYWIRILTFSSVTFKTSIKKYFFFFPSFFADYILKLHLHHFSKIKSHKEVTKQ